jgi:hypothetical protein
MTGEITREQSDQFFLVTEQLARDLKKGGWDLKKHSQKFLKAGTSSQDASKTLAAITSMLKLRETCKTKDEFYEAIMSNELPPLKLSPEEMFMVKGGALPFIGLAAYVALDFAVDHFTGHSIEYHAAKLTGRAAGKIANFFD